MEAVSDPSIISKKVVYNLCVSIIGIVKMKNDQIKTCLLVIEIISLIFTFFAAIAGLITTSFINIPEVPTFAKDIIAPATVIGCGVFMYMLVNAISKGILLGYIFLEKARKNLDKVTSF